MILRIAYKKYPAPATPGGFFYAASLPVDIGLSAGSSSASNPRSKPRSKRFDALIDSGASSCLFHASIGRAIGLEIEKGQRMQTLGVSGDATMYLHEVALSVPGGVVVTQAGFSDQLPIAGLLGMLGFFEHFKITFDPTALAVELERVHRA